MEQDLEFAEDEPDNSYQMRENRARKLAKKELKADLPRNTDKSNSEIQNAI